MAADMPIDATDHAARLDRLDRRSVLGRRNRLGDALRLRRRVAVLRDPGRGRRLGGGAAPSYSDGRSFGNLYDIARPKVEPRKVAVGRISLLGGEAVSLRRSRLRLARGLWCVSARETHYLPVVVRT